ISIVVIIIFMPSWLRLESIGGSSDMFTFRLAAQLKDLERWVSAKAPMFRDVDLAKEVTARASAFATRFFEELPALVTTFLVNLLLVPFIAYFMTRDGKTIKRRLVELVPNRYFEMTLI